MIACRGMPKGLGKCLVVVWNSGSFSLRLVHVLPFQVYFRKLATFGYFIVKGTLTVDTNLLSSLNGEILSSIIGHVAIVRVSRALKQTIFVVTCAYCLS